jgi:DNA polymerase elongation subunit (family B)
MNIEDIFNSPYHNLYSTYNELLLNNRIIVNNTILAQQLIILLNIDDKFYKSEYINNQIHIELIDEEIDCIVLNVEYLGETEEDVYDIETEVSTFQAGVGNHIIHNTDSIFITVPSKLETKSNKKEIIEEAIENGIIIADDITKAIGRPNMLLEYEKVFLPLVLFSKKRYVGNKYEENGTDFSRNSMGIVTKRRDNAPILKDIYNGTLDLILSGTNHDELKLNLINYIDDFLNKMVSNQFDLNKFIVTKTVKNKYSNPDSIAHKVLADRMFLRDPGSAPQTNDRVPYAFIQIKESQLKKNKINKIIECVEYNLKKMTKENQKQMIIELFKHTNNVKKTDEFKCINSIINSGIVGDRIKDSLLSRDTITKEIIRIQIYEPIKKIIKIIQGDRIEHPDYIKENNLKIDYLIYIQNQIMTPVLQLTNLVTEECQHIIESYIRKQNNLKNGSNEISKWFTSS